MGSFSIDKLYARWINLEHREDRRKLMEPVCEDIEALGIPALRFGAFMPDDWCLPKEDAPKLYGTKTAGNWLSHERLIQFAAETGRNIMVLEDDIYLASDFGERLQYLEDSMTLPWDWIALSGTFHLQRNAPGGLWHPEIGRDVERTPIKHLFRAYGVWSNHGYVVNGQSAGKVLAAMRSVLPVARGSDHALILVQPQLDAYVFVPGMVMQRDGVSDVAENGGFTRFSDFLKMGPYVFQDRLGDWDVDEYDWAEADK